MLCLITGGAGFIGSHVARLLLANGHTVRVVDNLLKGSRDNLTGLPVEFVEGDIRDQSLMQALTADVAAVFHLAALISNVKSVSDPEEDCRVNALGTVTVLHAAAKNKVKRFVYSSSAAIFGELKTNPIDESHPLEPISPYGVSKLAGERYCLAFGKLYPMTVVALRYFNVYGEHQRYDEYGNVIPIFANRLLDGQSLTIFGDGEQTRDFVHVRDVAQANYLAATRAKQSDIYNVGTGHSITINDLAERIQKASGIRSDIGFAPRRQGEVIHCRAEIGKIKTALGYEPRVPMDRALVEYFDWFKRDRTHGLAS